MVPPSKRYIGGRVTGGGVPIRDPRGCSKGRGVTEERVLRGWGSQVGGERDYPRGSEGGLVLRWECEFIQIFVLSWEI